MKEKNTGFVNRNLPYNYANATRATCELDLSLHKRYSEYYIPMQKRYIVSCHLYTEMLQLYQLYAFLRMEWNECSLPDCAKKAERDVF